jgi:hypothetical protein
MSETNVLIGFTKWIFKWLGIIAGGLVVLSLVVFAVWWPWNWWSHERHKNALVVRAINSQDAERISKVKTKDNIVPCAETEFPVFVGFSNKSSRVVEYIRVRVTAHLPNHSTDILSYQTVESDRIVPPGDRWAKCYQPDFMTAYEKHPDLKKAVYEAKVDHVRFKE